MADDQELDLRQLRELLPLAANRSLTPAQQAQLAQGLARHPELKHELLWLTTLRQTVQEQPLDPLPGGDLGWEKLAQRMAADAQHKRPAAHHPHRHWLAQLRDWLQPNAMPVLATACVLLVAQTVLIGTLVQREATFEAAGAHDPAVGNTAGVLLHVTVRPTVTEQQLREALRRFQARIVNGPSALGIYTLRLDTQAGAQAAAQQLTTEGGAVFDSATPAREP